jgi:Fur family iron response transcriptional regulator
VERSKSVPDSTSRLRVAGLRPTRQRLALAGLLFPNPGHKRHVTAEVLHDEARKARVTVSLATVYNTLHQFTQAGLLREVNVSSGASYFDTNTSPHHHVLNEDTGSLRDLEPGGIKVSGLPKPPWGAEISRVDVVVRVRKRPTKKI